MHWQKQGNPQFYQRKNTQPFPTRQTIRSF
ncbi:MAG: CRISPR-associated protein Cas5 [Methanocorpusculum sp.]|nr:CRISPR-associated protein Cas5 [Methanocorpusculum sp.]